MSVKDVDARNASSIPVIVNKLRTWIGLHEVDVVT